MCLPICDGCVTLDRRIESIRKARLDRRNLEVHSKFFRYLDAGCGGSFPDDTCDIQDMGDGYPTHFDLPYPMHLVAYSDQDEDADTRIKFNYVEPHNAREVRHSLQLVKGTKLANRPKFTAGNADLSGVAEYVRSIKKPRTNGYVYVFGYDANPGIEDLVWLTTMAPDETNTGYRRYRIPGITSSVEKTLDCIVTLRWVPLYAEDDISLIQQPDAYKRMARGLAALEGGDDRDYERWKNRAVKLLEKQKVKRDGSIKRIPNIAIRHPGARIKSTAPRTTL